MIKKLKPCPFCGSEVRWCGDDPKELRDCDQITCDSCGMQFNSYDKRVTKASSFKKAKKIVAKLWNRRT